MMSRTFALLALVLACAAACAGLDMPSSLAAYDRASVCCATLGQLPVETLPPDANVVFDLGEGSPAFAFGEQGKSYFKAFEIPPLTAPTRLVVRSYVLHDGLVSSGAAFIPVVTFLDEQRNPVASTDPRALKIRQGTMFDAPSEGLGNLEYETILTPDSGIRYVVVHSGREFIRSGVAIQHPNVKVTGPNVPRLPPFDTVPMTLLVKGSPAGHLRVRLASGTR